MDRPLTVKEAAEFLQITTPQVRLYINKNLLKAQKIGNGTKKGSTGRWRIWKHDLVEFVNRSGNVKER